MASLTYPERPMCPQKLQTTIALSPHGANDHICFQGGCLTSLSYGKVTQKGQLIEVDRQLVSANKGSSAVCAPGSLAKGSQRQSEGQESPLGLVFLSWCPGNGSWRWPDSPAKV